MSEARGTGLLRPSTLVARRGAAQMTSLTRRSRTCRDRRVVSGGGAALAVVARGGAPHAHRRGLLRVHRAAADEVEQVDAGLGLEQRAELLDTHGDLLGEARG